MPFVYEEAGTSERGFIQLRSTDTSNLYATYFGTDFAGLRPDAKVELSGPIGDLIAEWDKLHQQNLIMPLISSPEIVDHIANEGHRMVAECIRDRDVDRFLLHPPHHHLADEFELMGEAIASGCYYPDPMRRFDFVEPRSMIYFALRSIHDSIHDALGCMGDVN